MALREGQTGTAPDGTRVIFRGGKVIPLGADGSEGGPKARSDWGQGAVELPNGAIARYGPRGGMEILQRAPEGTGGAAGGDLKEYMVKAGSQAVLMDQALTDYDAARQEGYDPAGFRNTIAMGIEGVAPKVGPFIADVIRDDPSERGRAAELQYTEGALRALTGAAATDPETRRTARNMFRQPGESAAVEPNKEMARERFAGQIKRAAGSAYIPPSPPKAVREAAAKLPAPARSVYRSMFSAGEIDTTKPRGTQANPYLARSPQVAARLPKGSWVILPNGDLARKDR
jgi:hypothetical protein